MSTTLSSALTKNAVLPTWADDPAFFADFADDLHDYLVRLSLGYVIPSFRALNGLPSPKKSDGTADADKLAVMRAQTFVLLKATVSKTVFKEIVKGSDNPVNRDPSILWLAFVKRSKGLKPRSGEELFKRLHNLKWEPKGSEKESVEWNALIVSDIFDESTRLADAGFTISEQMAVSKLKSILPGRHQINDYASYESLTTLATVQTQALLNGDRYEGQW